MDSLRALRCQESPEAVQPAQKNIANKQSNYSYRLLDPKTDANLYPIQHRFRKDLNMKTYLIIALGIALISSAGISLCDGPKPVQDNWEHRLVHKTIGALKAGAAGLYFGLFVGACACAGVSIKRLALDHEHYDDPDAVYDCMQLSVSLASVPAFLYFFNGLVISSYKSFHKAQEKTVIT